MIKNKHLRLQVFSAVPILELGWRSISCPNEVSLDPIKLIKQLKKPENSVYLCQRICEQIITQYKTIYTKICSIICIDPSTDFIIVIIAGYIIETCLRIRAIPLVPICVLLSQRAGQEIDRSQRFSQEF